MRVKVLWFLSLFIVFSGLLGPITTSDAEESISLDHPRLAIAGNTICVIDAESKVVCRESSHFEDRPAPLGLGSVVSIQGGGDDRFCAITTTRNLKCWEYDGSSSGRFVLEPTGTFKKVSVGFGMTCGVNEFDRLNCWGDFGGEFAPLGEIKQVKTESVSRGIMICTINMEDLARCWNKFDEVPTEVAIPMSLGKVKQIDIISSTKICFLDFSARILCSSFETSANSIRIGNLEVQESLPPAKFISNSTCISDQLGELACWSYGRNQEGSLVPFRVSLSDPTSERIPPSIKVTEIVRSGSGQVVVLSESGWIRLLKQQTPTRIEVLPNNNQFGQIFTPLKHVGKPSVSATGKFIVGQLIKSKVDNWDTRFTTNFQWMRDGVEIEGENGRNYRLRIEDIGSVISLRVAGSRYGAETFEVVSNELSINKATINGSPCSDSKKKSVDAWAEITDWKNTTGLPAITGKMEFGKSVKANYGVWNKGVSLCSFWSVGTGDYLKDSGGILKLTGREVGQNLRLVVIGRNKAGIAVVRFSEESNVSKTAFPSTVLPKTSTVQVGKPITIQPNWASGTKYTCEWGTATSSQSEDSRVYGCTYNPKPSDLDYGITVSVCGSHPNYISFCRAGLVGITLPPEMPKIGLVKIATKSPKVGSILKGQVSGFMEGVIIESQWLANGVTITSANNSDFQVPGSLKGYSISYKVTVSLPGYMSVTKVSSPVKIP